MDRKKVAIIGAGQRGEMYASYALRNAHQIEIVAIAEPITERRNKFQKLYSLPESMCFEDWRDLLSAPKLADAVIICTQDRMHFEVTMKALETGYHILLEKPMSTDPQECRLMGEKAKQHDKVFSICHVLRFTSFFATIKKMLDEDRIGSLISIQHNENVGYWHQAHSYVRGNWSKTEEASPMILSKSSHDLDMMLWLAGADCLQISSFGCLSHFKTKNAPEGAPKRCLDGCPIADECAYYAPKQYLTKDTEWPTSAISVDTSYEARLQALQIGPYGRCVYHCDNDVVDHQVVNMYFENEVTGVFTMSAFTNDCNRTIKLMGTRGEIRGTMEKNEIEITTFDTGIKELIRFPEIIGHVGHGGGDDGLMKDFIKRIGDDRAVQGRTSAINSVQSHLMAFAAEQSRLEGRVIHMKEFIGV
ncbi:MAG: Gfo/Idh/MocA family oxidoreductase [Paenibacillaceae bacterium]